MPGFLNDYFIFLEVSLILFSNGYYFNGKNTFAGNGEFGLVVRGVVHIHVGFRRKNTSVKVADHAIVRVVFYKLIVIDHAVRGEVFFIEGP